MQGRMQTVTISAFKWVPPFAQGNVRDLRVRWALEEAGIAYETQLIDGSDQKSETYRSAQPFGQVPTYRCGDLTLFESGAIVLHVAERSETLLPSEPGARARAVAWVFAALNSIEIHVQQLAEIDLFHAGEDWAAQRRPGVLAMIKVRLAELAERLGERRYLEGEFTAGDLMMSAVLRILRHTNVLDDFPTLAAYQSRCEARPAFRRALAAQMNDFESRPPS